MVLVCFDICSPSSFAIRWVRVKVRVKVRIRVKIRVRPPSTTFVKELSPIHLFHKRQFLHGNEARMHFSRLTISPLNYYSSLTEGNPLRFSI